MKGFVKLNLVVGLSLAIFILAVEVVCEGGTDQKRNIEEFKASQQNSDGLESNRHKPLSGAQVLSPTENGSLGNKPNPSKILEDEYIVGINRGTITLSPSHNTSTANHSEMNRSNISLLMEGGGKVTPDRIAVASPETTHSELEKHEEDFHASGSKGRKGVPQISSVVPRKGVPEDGGNKSVTLDSTEHLSSNIPNEPTQTYINPSHMSLHNKKPEYVSDKEDVDDFDKYSIIKTSTTGEDYVIIGIVIVIGIWFSVFGGLIFYRRAGEYWDRRHYRRMDFLVEGMYND